MPRAAKYQAFISYRHDASGQLAVALEKALRQYAKPLYKPPIRVFRDEKQIGAGQDLRNTIQQALKDSVYLIYIATREAAESPYVRQELDFWCGALKRQDRLIIIWQKDRLIADPEHDRLDWAASNAIPSNLSRSSPGFPSGWISHGPSTTRIWTSGIPGSNPRSTRSWPVSAASRRKT